MRKEPTEKQIQTKYEKLEEAHKNEVADLIEELEVVANYAIEFRSDINRLIAAYQEASHALPDGKQLINDVSDIINSSRQKLSPLPKRASVQVIKGELKGEQ